jgi:hypothetical protein
VHADATGISQSQVLDISNLSSINWIEVILGFLATLIGVLLAFELERWREEKSRKERVIGALEMIKDEVEKNITLCRQIDQDFTDPRRGLHYVQYYTLKTTTWEAVSPALVDLKSHDLSVRIQSEYYEYDHMKRKIDARLDIWKQWEALGGKPPSHGMEELFSDLTQAVWDGTRTLQKSGETTKKQIEAELGRLRD